MAPFLQTVLDSSAIPSLQGVKFISSDLADLANATAVGGGKYDLVSTLSTVKSLRMGLAGLVCFMIITDQFQRCYVLCQVHFVHSRNNHLHVRGRVCQPSIREIYCWCVLL